MAIEIQRAVPRHAKDIYTLIRSCADMGLMLPRALSDIYESMRDFVIAVDTGHDNIVIGCCALHVMWDDLAEVRSLAVRESQRKHGVGRGLVEYCLDDARAFGIRRVFALTYVPRFFHKLGFHDLEKEALPLKVWSDCVRCHKYPDCDELAVAIDLH
jgi:amino-acid N-acetyltransferase